MKGHNIFIKKLDFACHLDNVIRPNPNKMYDVVTQIHLSAVSMG